MQYDLEQAPDIHTVHSFAWDSVWIGDRLQAHSFIITPDTVIADWSARVDSLFTTEDLTPLQNLDADIILIGTGPQQHLPDMAPFKALLSRGKSIQFMNSAAACRTYNILAMELRNVAAGIILQLKSRTRNDP